MATVLEQVSDNCFIVENNEGNKFGVLMDAPSLKMQGEEGGLAAPYDEEFKMPLFPLECAKGLTLIDILDELDEKSPTFTNEEIEFAKFQVAIAILGHMGGLA